MILDWNISEKCISYGLLLHAWMSKRFFFPRFWAKWFKPNNTLRWYPRVHLIGFERGKRRVLVADSGCTGLGGIGKGNYRDDQFKALQDRYPQIFSQLFIKSHCCFAKSTCLHMTSKTRTNQSHHTIPIHLELQGCRASENVGAGWRRKVLPRNLLCQGRVEETPQSGSTGCD